MNCRDSTGSTALHGSAAFGKEGFLFLILDVVKLLLAQPGIDVNAQVIF